MEFIDLKTQRARLESRLEERFQTVARHGMYIMGPEVEELEKRLADFTGSKYCISNSSGTDALLMAMMCYGIGPGDEVLTSPFTFFATGEMISLLGATPVYVDVDPDNYNLDPKLIEAKITSRTKAIMPVSLYGQCADMDPINQIAAKHNIPVIEDAAQSFGAAYRGKKSCALSAIGATSFFPSKPLGAYGDAGACFTDDEKLAKMMREIRTHGQERRYYHTRIGINGRLDTYQAAILLCKMEIFEEEVKLRDQIGRRYIEKLSPFVKTMKVSEDTCVFAQFTVEVPKRDQVIELLKSQGIPTAVHYPIPLHMQPVYQDMGFKAGLCPISEEKGSLVMSLPMHPYLDLKTQDFIVSKLEWALKEVRGR